jgi:hypothetical protein
MGVSALNSAVQNFSHMGQQPMRLAVAQASQRSAPQHQSAQNIATPVGMSPLGPAMLIYGHNATVSGDPQPLGMAPQSCGHHFYANVSNSVESSIGSSQITFPKPIVIYSI